MWNSDSVPSRAEISFRFRFRSGVKNSFPKDVDRYRLLKELVGLRTLACSSERKSTVYMLTNFRNDQKMSF